MTSSNAVFIAEEAGRNSIKRLETIDQSHHNVASSLAIEPSVISFISYFIEYMLASHREYLRNDVHYYDGNAPPCTYEFGGSLWFFDEGLPFLWQQGRTTSSRVSIFLQARIRRPHCRFYRKMIDGGPRYMCEARGS